MSKYNKKGVLIVVIIVVTAISYFIFKEPIWVSCLIIASGTFFGIAVFKK